LPQRGALSGLVEVIAMLILNPNPALDDAVKVENEVKRKYGKPNEIREEKKTEINVARD
jgi:hypothetical protein